jgi:MFS family permease
LKKQSSSDKASWKTKLAIYAVSFNSMDNFVLSVSMSGLIRAFLGVSENTLMYLLSITTLTAILGGFAFSFLSANFSKKRLTAAGLAVGCAAALIYLLFPTNLPMLFVSSALQGLVSGFVATAFPLLVNAHVRGAERSKVMGIGAGMVQFGRLAAFLVAGFLANLRWNYVYFAYIFMFAAFFLVVFLLPADEPLASGQAQKQGKELQREIWGKLAKSKGFLQLMAVALLFGVVNFLASSHVSLYIEGYELGLPSMTGMLTGFSCLLAGVTGLVFAPIYKVTGRRTHVFVFLLIGVGFVVAGSFVGLPFILIAVAFTMIASPIFLTYTLLCVFKVSDDQTAPMVMALVPTLINAGSFLSPIIMNGMAGTFGDGSAASAYLYGGILTIVVGVGLIIFLRWNVYDRDGQKLNTK